VKADPDRLVRVVATDRALAVLRRCAERSGASLHVVGGYVRDALIGREVRDTDFILSGPAPAFLGEVSRKLGRRVVTFRKKGITDHRLVWKGREFDFVERGRRSLEAELRRRDFTLNALALDLGSGRLLDPTGGTRDLAGGRLRATGPGVFADDPLRLLRAVRLVTEMPGLHIERGTRALIGTEFRRIRRSAPERVRDELDRILAARRSFAGVELLDRTGLLSACLPEVDPLRGLEQNRYHHLDAWGHTLECLRVAERPGLLGRGVLPAGEVSQEDGRDLRWALLLHDLGKAECRERNERGEWSFHNHHLASERIASRILGRLRFSRRRARRIRRLVREHLRITLAPGGLLSARAQRRIIRDLGEDTPLLVLHSLADQRASLGRAHARTRRDLRRACRDLLALYREQLAALTALPTLLDGRELMRVTGLDEGPEVGRLLRTIRSLQVDGELSSPEEAIAWLREGRS
jgi:tRNA nucleotidyltransferase/poly(A) polymerase